MHYILCNAVPLQKSELIKCMQQEFLYVQAIVIPSRTENKSINLNFSKRVRNIPELKLVITTMAFSESNLNRFIFISGVNLLRER